MFQLLGTELHDCEGPELAQSELTEELNTLDDGQEEIETPPVSEKTATKKVLKSVW